MSEEGFQRVEVIAGVARRRRRSAERKLRSVEESLLQGERVVDRTTPWCCAALLNRDRAARGDTPFNHKRLYRIVKHHGLLLEKHSGTRLGRCHAGKVVVMRSNLRRCSDGLEFTCRNGGWSGRPWSSMPMTVKSSLGRR